MPSSNRVQRNSQVPFPFVVGMLLAAVVGVVAYRAQASGPAKPAGSSAPTGGRGGTSPGPSSSPALALQPLPACTFGSERTVRTAYREWRTVILDTSFRLSKSYSPPGLVSTTRAGFTEGLLVRKVVIKDLGALREAAEAAGNPVGMIAAYRSYQQQAELFAERKAKLGEDAALRKTARAGHSEHQLGTTVDFKTAGEKDVDQKWSSTPAGAWTKANAWRFGFVLSYPRGKNEVTCYGYEPWHFRYVGRTLAAKVHESGLTLREFLWKWDQEHPE
jgi:D-alanyl-D-alanine carboxypeptidase